MSDAAAAPILLRRSLSAPLRPLRLPAGLTLAPPGAPDLRAVHALLRDAYANGFGQVADHAPWQAALVSDSEYDPDLVFLVLDASGDVAATAQCWTSAFIKDLAVREDWRRRGVGAALLTHVLAAFAARGAPHVDLKVVPANHSARALYASMGFVPVA